ncbi:hypothetical protein GGR52DRAFT_22485 [Hypoxylon sp. FL1284]|nr:hypothetical protein GGR52DRAFT_22485 [Hypoxylon sp. FL1284]
MCNEDIFTYVYPDRQRVEQVKYELCERSRHGQPCKLTRTFQHPDQYVQPGQLSPPAHAMGQFPPTPPLSSHSASASDSEHSSKGRRGRYIEGEKVIDLNRRSSRRDKGDRTVYVEGSSLSRTPPRKYSIPRSSPSSPRDEVIQTNESRRREKSPVERKRHSSSHSRSQSRSQSRSRSRPRSIEVKVVNEPRSSNHRRHGSSKSSSQSGDDEERRRRRRGSHVRFEEDEKTKKIQSQIERDNEAIANRPPVPVSQPSSSARYRRGSVVVDRGSKSLITAMDKLNIERENWLYEQQAKEQRQREEQEAQKQRLMERMAPKRPAAVTNGSARGQQKLLRDDGFHY